MAYYKIKVIRENRGSKPEVKKLLLPYDNQLFRRTTNTIYNLIFRAEDMGILDEAICIRIGTMEYYSLIKITGIEPEYRNIPIIVDGYSREPEMFFSAKTNLTHEKEIEYVNKANSTPSYIP